MRLMVSNVPEHALAVASELRPVILRLSRELRRETEQFGVTSRQATLLWLVRSRPGASLSELAAEEGVSTPSLSVHVDRLVGLGLVERRRSDTDRRRVVLELTDDGTRVLRSVRERRTAWLASRLTMLPARELRALESALPALARLAAVESA
jgi:DNA-binding MarR family transcriptional regulator